MSYLDGKNMHGEKHRGKGIAATRAVMARTAIIQWHEKYNNKHTAEEGKLLLPKGLQKIQLVIGGFLKVFRREIFLRTIEGAVQFLSPI